ncbi:hypothetical protein CEE37_12880 [candidate division LCP-89 bacterium B3_LCP]|uniref:Uncharacterized protein n=1 Tax=candidate division LCP-89 bacterium B3_LCP TaxID=2012998 RepID=A0A532UTY7_UNCL8|nr:MAG: hypothetical protein CEE37_12880 [candidate division LCP-89 bacterium B3_LCP]
MRKSIILLVTLILAEFQVNASEPVSARVQGMGGAGVALPTDVSAVYWNPAGLYLQNRMAMDFSFRFDELNLPDNWGFSYLNYSRSTRHGAGLGIYRFLDKGHLDGGNALAILMATVYKTPIGLPVGLSFKYINERWSDEDREGYWTGDLGFLLPYGPWLFSACVQSITHPGSHLVPYRILTGLSWTMNGKITAAVQGSALEWEDLQDFDLPEWRIGAEIRLSDSFAGQGGWVSAGSDEYWTFGLSIIQKRRARLSCAYHWYPTGGNNDRFYLSYGYFLQ